MKTLTLIVAFFVSLSAAVAVLTPLASTAGYTDTLPPRSVTTLQFEVK